MIAFIPINTPFALIDSPEILWDYYYKAIEDFKENIENKSLLQIINSSINSISAEVIKLDENFSHPIIDKYFLDPMLIKANQVEYVAQITFNFEDNLDESIFMVENFLNKFFLLEIICYAGSLNTFRGVVYVQDKFIGETQVIYHEIDSSVSTAINKNWPPINLIKFSEIIEWIKSNKINLGGYNTTPANRALNAFSYLIENEINNTTSHLFWALLGIEAIYSTGKDSIQNQIKSKTELYLGEIKTNKKDFNKLYGYRSRFIHGDLDFFPKDGHDFDENSKDFGEFIFYTDYARAILLSTLQKMIHENKVELLFDYKLLN